MKEVIKETLTIKEVPASESMQKAHFFNSSKFLLNKPFYVRGWQLISDKQPVSQIFFYIKDTTAISGYQSTFGSFDVLNNVTSDELKWFIKQLVITLKQEGIKKIKIKNFPSYFGTSSTIEDALLALGFENVLTEINQHIEVNKANFEEVANRSEVIRSNKCSKLNYEFKIVSLQELPQIYDLIEATLKRKGNRPSMAYEKLKQAIEVCPTNYFLFSLWDADKLIAAVVSVKLNDSTLYNFYHADHLEYRPVSSFTYLLKNIYLYCYCNHIKILDIGISTVNGVLNKGLFNFKKSRGAISTTKNYFNLSL